MRQHSVFEIQLAEKEIIFHGSPSECAGKILQGSLLVHPGDNLRVKKISLHLVGRMHTHWTTGAGTLQRTHSENRILIEKEWIFLQQQKKPHVLAPGTHFYDFEITLPGDLPPSVLIDYGLVEYKFKALLERPTFSVNYTDRKMLSIKRALLPSAPVLSELIYLSDTWNDMLHYEVYSPYKAFGQGEDLPLHFKLLSLDEGLRIQSITCLLKEYITVHAHSEDGVLSSKSDGRVQARSNKTITQTDSSLELTLTVPIPPAYRDGVHSFIDSELIRIDHKVKILIVLSDSQDRLHRILAKVGVVIMPTPRNEALNALPLYQSYAPVPAQVVEPDVSDFPLNLPSYRTEWCPLGHTPSLSSLPGYGSRLVGSELAR